MAAIQNVPEVLQSLNSDTRLTRSIVPRCGVVTLFGYGISVHVDRGHLIFKDGIGTTRREARCSRVGHGIRRLVVIGSDGIVSLAALRWLADQNASFVMLERDGSVLATTGPVRPSDARLRRAQALAHHSGVDVKIARELIARKLKGQEEVVRTKLHNPIVADSILGLRLALAETETMQPIRLLESQSAYAYWTAWHNIPIAFPKNDLRRVPEHWLNFGSRHSPLTGSPRLAVNPPNAILNYLYAILESESRLAIAALGLDPGIGVMHVDSPSRDSLACDLMEVVRPQVDAYLLDWIVREPLHREWFFEQRNGNCRLMAQFAFRLSETAPTWARAVAPIAEWVLRTLWSTMRKPTGQAYPATRLTQSRRRQAKGSSFDSRSEDNLRPLRICRICGASIKKGQTYCASCVVGVSREGLIEAAKLGRIATHTLEAETLRAKTQRKHAAAIAAWQPSELPQWLNEEAYWKKIQPALAGIPISTIASALDISEPYATNIRKGRRLPHRRHWQALAQLIDDSPNDQKKVTTRNDL
jgi:CRISPR-associated endonuclease Cas1